MSKPSTFLLISAGALLISACGSNSAPQLVPSETGFMAASIDDVYPVSKAFPQVSIIDEIKTHTPRSLATGLIVIAHTNPTGRTGFDRCIGFLVTPDIVATNSHCIPEDLRVMPSLCSERLAVMFPAAAGLGAENHLCRQILSASDIIWNPNDPDYALLPDYAYFRIDSKSARNPIHLNPNGIGENDTLTTYTYDPVASNDGLISILRKKECVSHKGSSIYSNTSRWSPVALAFGPECEIIPGNSGSPALNAKGEAVGIIHGTVMRDDRSDFARTHGARVTEAPEPLGIITNMACALRPKVEKSGRATWSTHPKCGTAEKVSKRNRNGALQALEQNERQVRNDLQKMFRSGRATASDMFVYNAYPILIEPTLDDIEGEQGASDGIHSGYLLFQPICIKAEMIDAATNNGPWAIATDDDVSPQQELKTTLQIPAFEHQLSLDRYLRPTTKLRPLNPLSARIEIDTSLVSSQNNIAGIISVDSRPRLIVPLVLRYCSPEDLGNGDELIYTSP